MVVKPKGNLLVQGSHGKKGLAKLLVVLARARPIECLAFENGSPRKIELAEQGLGGHTQGSAETMD